MSAFLNTNLNFLQQRCTQNHTHPILKLYRWIQFCLKLCFAANLPMLTIHSSDGCWDQVRPRCTSHTGACIPQLEYLVYEYPYNYWRISEVHSGRVYVAGYRVSLYAKHIPNAQTMFSEQSLLGSYCCVFAFPFICWWCVTFLSVHTQKKFMTRPFSSSDMGNESRTLCHCSCL